MGIKSVLAATLMLAMSVTHADTNVQIGKPFNGKSGWYSAQIDFLQPSGLRARVTCQRYPFGIFSDVLKVRTVISPKAKDDATMNVPYAICVDMLLSLRYTATDETPLTLVLSEAKNNQYTKIGVAEFPMAFKENTDDKSVQKLVDWAIQYSQRHGDVLGKTEDGKLCSFSTFDKSLDGSQKEAYISLGTSTDGSTNPDHRTWVGMAVNPDRKMMGAYNVTNLNITDTEIDFGVYQDEVDAKGVNNRLTITLNDKGEVTKVVGTSDKWPSSTCIIGK